MRMPHPPILHLILSSVCVYSPVPNNFFTIQLLDSDLNQSVTIYGFFHTLWGELLVCLTFFRSVVYLESLVCLWNKIFFYFWQLYTVQNILPKDHVTPVRYFAEKPAPTGLKGDGQSFFFCKCTNGYFFLSSLVYCEVWNEVWKCIFTCLILYDILMHA